MPKYRATVGFNAWHLRHRRFTAKNDAAARAMRQPLNQWVSETLLKIAKQNATDISSTPDAVVLVDRLDDKGEIEQEIDRFDHSESIPLSDALRAFTTKIAHLALFAESDYVNKRPDGADPEAVQTDLNWLTAQHEALESLIREARDLIGFQNHPTPDTT
ncbi:MAG: hypothetical protein ACLPPF_18885 [Rhodomicrobium sp.]